MGILFTDPDTGYAAAVSGQVVGTTDGGQTWSNVVGEPFDAIIGDLALVDGALIIVGRYGDVYRAPLECPAVADVPEVLELGGTLCTGTAAGIRWSLNGNPLVGETQSCITPSLPGSYTVVTTDALGCVSQPSDPVMVISTQTAEASKSGFRVAPNPGNGLFTLTFDEAASREVLVHDLLGRAIGTFRAQGKRLELDLQEQPPGLYLLRSPEGGEAVRLIKN
ncbi:MAG: T9SS type A sorting domain-containing protein [Flavobacteriales bacterium]|nr:T9SS type A sorting domain-containing protein [Flavobacteriales bacterium]